MEGKLLTSFLLKHFAHGFSPLTLLGSERKITPISFINLHVNKAGDGGDGV